jgi:hypothetical protein
MLHEVFFAQNVTFKHLALLRHACTINNLVLGPEGKVLIVPSLPLGINNWAELFNRPLLIPFTFF